MTTRTDYDSWPWRGHERQGEDDARRGWKNRDLYDRYDGEHKMRYTEAYDRQERRIEEERREEREEEERQEERRVWERAREIQMQEEAEVEYQEKQQEYQDEEEP